MYDGAGAINTGVPGAIIVYTTADNWAVAGGVALGLVGLLNLLLALRASRLQQRSYPGA